jgi:hypothetical protein
MMNQHKFVRSAILLGVMMCVVVGCDSSGDSDASAQPVVRAAPKTTTKPASKSVEQLMSSLSIDDRIHFEDAGAPRSEAARVAVLRFADALLKVDTTTLLSMLSFGDQLELDAMTKAGLGEQMNEVSLVIMYTGTSPDGRDCMMLVYEVGMEYQVQVWYYEKVGNDFSFTAAEIPPNLHNKLSGNWISSYFAMKEEQTEIANQPDEETSYTLAGDTTTSGSLDGGQGGPQGPSGPTGPRGPTGPGR